MISGNVSIAGQNVTILGASGDAFGTITGGTFTVASGDAIDFAGGNEFVNDAITGNVAVEQGMLAYQGAITGNLTVAPAGTLLASGSVDGSVTIGGTYEEDLAGATQAGATTALGANGDYSALQVTGTNGTVTIQSGATLAPELTNAAYVPGLGTKFTIVTAYGGVSGTFSTLVQPTMGVGTQLVATYDADHVYLGVAPSSDPSPFVGLPGTNAGGQSVGNVADQSLTNYKNGDATAAQTGLLYAATSLHVAQVPQLLNALDGQVHAAMVAVAPEAGQQMAGSVYDHLGEVASGPSTGALVWGNVSTEFGQRGSDSQADSFRSDVTQVVVGADLLARGATRLGIGYAFTSSTVNESTGNGTAHENAGFVYGQVPVGQFLVDGIGSYGASSTGTQRANPLGGTLLQANGVSGGDALVSLGISRPFAVRDMILAPYVRVTWQQVSEASYSEGSSSVAALSVDSFAGTGVLSMIGLTGGSAITSPLAAPTTYRFDLGVGEDAGNLLNPTLRASLVGIPMTITSPQVSSAFVQASISGTLRVTPSAYLYGQLFGAVRGNADEGGLTGGLRVRF